MRCSSCDKNLTDREASRKYLHWQEIPNPEERYINLCDHCIQHTGLSYEEDIRASDEEFQDEEYVPEDDETQLSSS